VITKKTFRRFALIPFLAGTLFATRAKAQASNETDPLPLRFKKPATFYVSAGDPAPSYIGVNMAYQFDPAFQIIAGMGVGWYSDLSVRTLALSSRFHLLRSNLAPMMGAGLSYFMLSGHGTIQGLETSTLLGSLMVGFDWAFKSGLRVSGGFSFHYPIKMNFPFVDVGWSFE
jgi:hypothetical protein